MKITDLKRPITTKFEHNQEHTLILTLNEFFLRLICNVRLTKL